MMSLNLVQQRQRELEEQNWVRRAHTKLHKFDFSQTTLDKHLARDGEALNLIFWGSEGLPTDFFVIPYLAIRHMFQEEYLARDNRKRWTGLINANVLSISHCPIRLDVGAYYGNPALLSLRKITSAVTGETEVENDYAIENRLAEVRIRLKQSVFRGRVLARYQSRCCISGIEETSLLVASHVVPWAARVETRLDPANGVCLFVLYDELFDQGYLAFQDDMDVIITPRLPSLSSGLQRLLLPLGGRRASCVAPPKPEYLAYHRTNIFLS